MNAPAHSIAVVVLAAGLSRRMGVGNKLLLHLTEGRTVLRTTLEQALQADLGPVIMVTGHDRLQAEREATDLPVQTVFAPEYAEGLAASLRAGLTAVPEYCVGALICLADMPLVPASVLCTLFAAFVPEAGRDIIQPIFKNTPGNPILWGRRHFTEMMLLSGDIGARTLLARNQRALCRIEVETSTILEDIDTHAQLRACRTKLKLDC